MTPRLQTHVPYDAYRALPGLAITRIKELARSPLHYRYRLEHPKHSPSLTLGSAAHVAVLEPERFERDYAVWGEEPEQKVRQGSVWEAFADEHRKQTIITVKEAAAARAIRDAVRSAPAAMRYLEKGDPEVTLEWIYEATACKGRVDWLTRDEGFPVLVGLKTARDCGHRMFAVQAARLLYFCQWSFYRDGYHAITGRGAKVVEIVVENTPPHDVAVYVVPSDVIEEGRNVYRDLIAKLLECEASGRWPGAQPEETRIALPKWVFAGDEDEEPGGIEGLEMRGDGGL